MAKQFTVSLDSLGDYIDLFNGIFDLTQREKQVLVYLLTADLQGQDAFDPDTKKDIAEEMGRDDHYFLNGYIQSLKEKNALLPTEEKGEYDFNPLLVPQGERHVIIELNWNL